MPTTSELVTFELPIVGLGIGAISSGNSVGKTVGNQSLTLFRFPLCVGMPTASGLSFSSPRQ